MPRKKGIEVSFLARLGRPHRRGGNLLIYVPKAVKEIYGLNQGDYCEVTINVVGREEEKGESG